MKQQTQLGFNVTMERLIKIRAGQMKMKVPRRPKVLKMKPGIYRDLNSNIAILLGTEKNVVEAEIIPTDSSVLDAVNVHGIYCWEYLGAL